MVVDLLRDGLGLRRLQVDKMWETPALLKFLLDRCGSACNILDQARRLQ